MFEITKEDVRVFDIINGHAVDYVYNGIADRLLQGKVIKDKLRYNRLLIECEELGYFERREDKIFLTQKGREFKDDLIKNP